jgi:hypothetical protein
MNRVVRIAGWLGVGWGVCGCAATSGSTDLLVVRSSPGWVTESSSSRVPMSRMDLKSGREVPAGSVPLAPQSGVTFSGTIGARMEVAAFAREHGLAERAATARENSAGWTEAYSRPDGATIRTREDDLGKVLSVQVIEGRGERLRPLLAARLGLGASDPTARRDRRESPPLTPPPLVRPEPAPQVR